MGSDRYSESAYERERSPHSMRQAVDEARLTRFMKKAE
jgi:hypothetical protein